MASPMKTPARPLRCPRDPLVGRVRDFHARHRGFGQHHKHLGEESEPEPDGCLFILPECGGRLGGQKGYLNGAPELIAEIGESSESIDLHAKKQDYEKAGVREYLVVALRQQLYTGSFVAAGNFRIDARRGRHLPLRCISGLWLRSRSAASPRQQAPFGRLEASLSSPEHTAFVAKLRAK